jgi:hypothetical protein
VPTYSRRWSPSSGVNRPLVLPHRRPIFDPFERRGLAVALVSSGAGRDRGDETRRVALAASPSPTLERRSSYPLVVDDERLVVDALAGSRQVRQ